MRGVDFAPGLTRLVGAILLEQNDEWAVSRRYMTLESIAPLSDGVPITLPRAGDLFEAGGEVVVGVGAQAPVVAAVYVIPAA